SPEAAAHAASAGTRHCAGAFGRAAITGPDRAARPEATHADPAAQTAALFYTTGTTGRPKGVRLSRRSLLFSAASSAELRGFAPGGHVLAALPGAHIFGFASILLAALFAGARLTLLARFDADAALDAFAAGADAFSGTPQMYPPLLARLAARVAAGAPAPRPRYVSAGGAPLDPALKARVEAAFGAPLHNGYGLTEAAPGVAATRPAAPRGDLACGPPMPGVSIRLDFAVGGAEPAAGIGEILARGPNVMQGYHRDPAATRAALDAEGWLRTGDLGRFTADGALEVLGRRSELIIRGGFNVRPAEVEAALASHSAVALAAVIGRPEPGGAGDEEVLAFVTLRPGAPAPSVAALRAHLAPRLTAYKRPSRIILADALPASATGKVLKSELARAFAEQLRGAAPR
ncbi:MAG: fatty acid--CoA ligase family protein, partial [Pseudomonadota bacterium]